MRIIAGNAKGRKLMSPSGDHKVRPTADRVKEAVFNIIGPCIKGFIVLDLFAGTGSLGLEALSRGAEFAIFVDKDPESLKVLKKNIGLTGFIDKSEVLSGDGLKVLGKLKTANKLFDLIFIDPPYEGDIYKKVPFLIEKYGIIRDGGYVIVEHPVSTVLDGGWCQLKNIKNKKYGNTAISIFTKGDDHEDSSISGKL